MTSILDFSASSDSEDDADFVPTGEVAGSESSEGEDNGSEGELETPKPKRAKKTKSSKNKKDVEETEISVPKPINGDSKKHADDIWKSFLSEVAEETSTSKSSTVTSADVSEIVKSSATPVESASNVLKEPTTTKVFEFAGEIFTVDNGHSCSLEKTKVAESSTATDVKGAEGSSKKRGGIDSVLGNLFNKKQKMTTLQKTLYDWKSFKKDEGIEEDLEKFNKGRGGFIERQRFLQRSDIRSFEVEKGIRQSRRKK